MLLLLLTLGIVCGGLAAIACAQPARAELLVWNDDAERRMLREAKVRAGWW